MNRPTRNGLLVQAARRLVSRLAAVALAAVLLVPLSASAVLIEILDAGESFLEVRLTEIDLVDDRVYVLDRKAGEVRFGDGAQGARPPSGGTGIIASYRFGDGGEGGIVNEYDLATPLPLLIPLTDFFPEDEDDRAAVQFVLVGVSSIDLKLSDAGLVVSDARLVAVAEPGTLALLAAGLLALAWLTLRARPARELERASTWSSRDSKLS